MCDACACMCVSFSVCNVCLSTICVIVETTVKNFSDFALTLLSSSQLFTMSSMSHQKQTLRLCTRSNPVRCSLPGLSDL